MATVNERVTKAWDEYKAVIASSATGARFKEQIERAAIEYDRIITGARLQEARATAGMTQTEAARRIGVTQATWSQYETGRIPVPAVAWEAVNGVADVPTIMGMTATAGWRRRTCAGSSRGRIPA